MEDMGSSCKNLTSLALPLPLLCASLLDHKSVKRTNAMGQRSICYYLASLIFVVCESYRLPSNMFIFQQVLLAINPEE